MKRLCLLSLVVFFVLTIILGAFPSVSPAQDDITIISSSTLVAFPLSITFNLEADASSPIIDIDLKYCHRHLVFFLVCTGPNFRSIKKQIGSWLLSRSCSGFSWPLTWIRNQQVDGSIPPARSKDFRG